MLQPNIAEDDINIFSDKSSFTATLSEGVLIVAYEENAFLQTNIGTITLSKGAITATVTVIQAGRPPVISFDPTSQEVSALPGIVTWSIESNLGSRDLTIASIPDWVNFADINDSKVLTVQYETNDSFDDRTGEVTITGRVPGESISTEATTTLVQLGQIPLSTETDFLTFSFAEQTADANINDTDHFITVEVGPATDVTNLTPSFTISEGASVNPANDVAQDFTHAITYTVTAEDGTTTQDWRVYVIQPNRIPVFIQVGSGFDVSTAIYSGDEEAYTLSRDNAEFNPSNLIFSNDGTKIYLISNSAKAILEFSLITPYDLSTIRPPGVPTELVVSLESQTFMNDIEFNSDGSKLFLLSENFEENTGKVREYTLSTPFDLTSASYSGVEAEVFDPRDGIF